MKIMIYSAESYRLDRSGNIYDGNCDYLGSNLETARKEAAYYLDHLTKSERKSSLVFVQGFIVDEEPGDTAEAVWERYKEASYGNPDYYEEFTPEVEEEEEPEEEEEEE